MNSWIYDSPEYLQRKRTPFLPTKVIPSFLILHRSSVFLPSSQVTLSQLHAAVPKHLYEKSTSKALHYVARDVFFAVLFYRVGTFIDPVCRQLAWRFHLSSAVVLLIKWALWSAYWWWQGVVLAGWWCLGVFLLFHIRVGAYGAALQATKQATAHYPISNGLIMSLAIPCTQ